MLAICPHTHLRRTGAATQLAGTTLRRPFNQDLQLLSYIALVAFERESVLKIDYFVQTAGLHLNRDIVRVLSRRQGSGALGVIEHERGIEADLLEEIERLAVVLLRLRAEACDYIGRYRAVGHQLADFIYTLEVPGCRVAATHLLEDAVGPGLDREVDMVADVGVTGHGLEHLVRNVLRVRGRETHAHLGAHLRDHREQPGKRSPFEIVGVHVLAQQGHLLIAFLGAVAGLTDDRAGVAAPLHSAGVWDYAVRTDVVAAAHDRDEGGNAVRIEADGGNVRISFLAREDYVDLGVAVGSGLKQLGQATVSIRTCHDVDLSPFEQLLLHSLGHAAEDTDHDRPASALERELTDTAEDALFGVVADRAGIRHYDVCFVHILRPGITMFSEDRKDHLGIGYIHLAAVGFYVYLFTHVRKDRQKVSIFGDVNKIVDILLALLAAVLLAGCSSSRNQFTITGGGMDSVRIGDPITAVANLNINNPSYKVKVSDISGKIKSGEKALLNVQADDCEIPARSSSTVFVPLEASLEPGVGFFSIMKIVSGGDYENLTADITFTATGLFGIKKTQTLENIPLKDLMKLL